MRLRRSQLAGPCILRRRRGRGFSYSHSDGTPVRDPETLDRLRRLAIPPAWQEVWICPWPNGHIQAVGRDDAGRRQYLYHEQWRRERDEEKHERVRTLAAHLPRLRTDVAGDLAGKGLTKRRVAAVALRMLEQGLFRVGSEEYVEENGSHGVTTLLREHVSVRKGRIEFCFPAKGGQERRTTLSDPELAKAVAALLRARTGSERLLVYRTPRGWRELHAQDVNDRLRELAGEEFTVKDLRTWNATVLAAVSLAAADRPASKRGRQRVVNSAIREVAEHLGNTPAIARKSYVDPRVIELFERGTTVKLTSTDLSDTDARTAAERAVARMLGSAASGS